MKRLLLSLTAALLLSSAPIPEYDIVIRHGRVLDGAGNPWVTADIAIKDGRVVKVGFVPGIGAREIDARDRYVSPGFIDMMDQSGAVLLKNGAAENKLLQGVTTLIAGESGTPVDALLIPTYFDRLESQGISVNFGTYYATHQARVKVMGDSAEAPTVAQLEAMRKEVRTAMRAGVFGVSSALIYPPSSFQTTSDLVALAEMAGQCGGFYASHMRDESEGLFEAVEEAIEIGEKARVKVEIFHLKAAFAPGWGRLMPKAIAAINAARDRGVDITADLYPYTAGGTGLDVTVPNWVWSDGQKKGVERLRDPVVRARLKKELSAKSQPGWSNLVHAAGGWENVVLANANSPKFDSYNGKNFSMIGKALGRDPEDVAWDILLEARPGRAMALFFLMSEEDIEAALRQPWTSIGSDAASVVRLGDIDALGLPHPRAYATFPRVIAEYVKRRKVLTLADAIRKMSGWPAQRMGLSDRGFIRENMWADIIIFDLERIDDVADWDNPTAFPTGIDTVIVNGQLTIDNGRNTGARAGAVLRHSCSASRTEP